MAMRKIDLTNYNVEVSEGKTLPYEVKKSITLALFNPELRLGMMDLLDNDRLSQKIKNSDGFVLLEEDEYNRLMRAFSGIHGFTNNDVELVKRILDAPIVGVKEA